MSPISPSVTRNTFDLLTSWRNMTFEETTGEARVTCVRVRVRVCVGGSYMWRAVEMDLFWLGGRLTHEGRFVCAVEERKRTCLLWVWLRRTVKVEWVRVPGPLWWSQSKGSEWRLKVLGDIKKEGRKRIITVFCFVFSIWLFWWEENTVFFPISVFFFVFLYCTFFLFFFIYTKWAFSREFMG